MDLTNFSVLGRGGFSTVYRADDASLGRPVAVKVLNTAFDEPGAWERFVRECQAMGRLSGHDGVVTVHSAGRSPAGQGYIVMEYLPAGSLAAHLRRVGSLSPEQAASVGATLASALVFTQGLGVVHRDIKPENVLLTDGGRPKLADFGIAGLSSTTAGLTSTASFTPDHVAPEVLRGEPAGTSADVYSLCSTLYQLLTGRSPFRRGADEPLATMLLRKVSEQAPALPEDVPEPLRSVVSAGLSVSPSDRPRAADVAGRLGAMSHAPLWEPGHAPMPSVGALVASPLGDTPTVVVAQTPTVTALDDGLTVVRAGAVTTVPVAGASARRARRPLVLVGVAAIGVLLTAGAVWRSAGAQERDRAASGTASTTTTTTRAGVPTAAGVTTEASNGSRPAAPSTVAGSTTAVESSTSTTTTAVGASTSASAVTVATQTATSAGSPVPTDTTVTATATTDTTATRVQVQPTGGTPPGTPGTTATTADPTTGTTGTTEATPPPCVPPMPGSQGVRMGPGTVGAILVSLGCTDHYLVSWSPDGPASPQRFERGSVFISGLRTCVGYSVQVRAVSAEGGQSDPYTFGGVPGARPDPPSILAVSTGPGQATVTVQTNSLNCTSYAYGQILANGTQVATFSPGTETRTVTLAPGQYTFVAQVYTFQNSPAIGPTYLVDSVPSGPWTIS